MRRPPFTRRSIVQSFLADRKANIAILFALTSLGVVMGTGAAIDLARGYSARQKLAETAILACQYASRPSIVDTAAASYSGANGGTTYQSNVNAFITATLQTQHFSYAQTNGAPFTYTQNGPADISLSATVPTTFMKVARITQIPISATSHCYDNPASLPQRSPDGNSVNLVQEGFENAGCSGTCFNFISPSGQFGQTVATPVSTPSSTTSYTGSGGAQWVIMGYCLEIDTAGIINSSDPEGTHSAELDCDNGAGTAGNSSISTKTYMAAGNYELRWFYRSRVDYPNYDPTYICGSTASDVSWANDTTTSGFSSVARTNQINAYLDLNTTGKPPTHLTIDGTQSLGGSNLIDVCVYSPAWVERSVRIKVTTPGYYWLSFAADGANDSYGGQLDSIRLCRLTCANSLQDNFPAAWLAANNSGSNKLLFEDSFESPVYTQDAYTSIPHSKSGNLVNSAGVTTTSCTSSSAPLGWPCQSATSSSATWASGYTKGWATEPVNETVQNLQGAYQGSQYPSLVGWNGFSSGSPSTNRGISRPFLLVPGYYRVAYDYISNVDFSASGAYGTNCYAAPASGFIFAASYPSLSGKVRYSSSTTADGTTNIVGVYMSHGQLVSTPINSGTSLGSTTQYTNPNGTISTTPTVRPDNVNWTSYSASAVNPVLDVCGYADSFRWVPRSVSIKITKPGIYWLTFSANGAVSANGNGGGIDDVTLTALGSLYMSNPPSSALTTIPVPDPQPSATVSYSGFAIVADPLAPPAP